MSGSASARPTHTCLQALRELTTSLRSSSCTTPPLALEGQKGSRGRICRRCAAMRPAIARPPAAEAPVS
eukprot:5039-Eustigmatos_ZCMA.PRE.1